MKKSASDIITQLIAEGESAALEFKSSFDRQVIETLSAFANSKGGTVLVGVNDRGKITGTQFGTETGQQWVNQVKSATAPTIIPDVEAVTIDGKIIVKITIAEYPIKPVSCKGKYFKRIHNSNHQLSLTEISNLHLQTFNTSWDHYMDARHSLEDISLDKVNSFIESANKVRPYPIDDAPMAVMKKFELVSGENITNGCFLLFAAGDCFASTIEIGRFASETIIKDGLTIRTDLFSEVEMVLDFLRKHMNRAYIITGQSQREERWDYPLEALREIVVNMIVHRDYMTASDSIIKIFDDRIEFFNPGKLLAGLNAELLIQGNYSSTIRNKQIASIFKEAGKIEKYGSGIKRIIDTFASYGLPAPRFEEFQHGFKVTVSGKTTQKTTRKTTRKTTQKIPGTKKASEQLLDILRVSPQMSRDELAAKLDKNPNTIKYHIKKLKAEGKIERIGSDRDGYWKVLV